MKHLTLLLFSFLLTLSLHGGDKKKAEVVKPNDTVQIEIKNVPRSDQLRINGVYVIRANGMLFMPMIKNSIQVKGLSTAQIATKLKKSYIKTGIYTAPIIDVLSLGDGFDGCILTKCSEIFSIGGHVKAPGPKPFITGMTLSHALAAAGGATPFGSTTRIELYRNHTKKIYNLRKPEHQKVKLQLGDTINVPQKNTH